MSSNVKLEVILPESVTAVRFASKAIPKDQNPL
jgi:hypothetical protein